MAFSFFDDRGRWEILRLRYSDLVDEDDGVVDELLLLSLDDAGLSDDALELPSLDFEPLSDSLAADAFIDPLLPA